MEIIEFILMCLSVVVLCTIAFDVGEIKATFKRIAFDVGEITTTLKRIEDMIR